MFFIMAQEGSKRFAVPTLGTTHPLFYSWITCGIGQHFWNTLLCGW